MIVQIRTLGQVTSPLPKSSLEIEASLTKYMIEQLHLSRNTIETKLENLRKLRKRANARAT